MRVDVFIRASFFSPFLLFSFFFFFNDTATTEIYTLSLHDALPIYQLRWKLPQSEFDVQATLASFAKPGWSFRYRGSLDLGDIRRILRKPNAPGGVVSFSGEGSYARKQVSVRGRYAAREIELPYTWFHTSDISSRGSYQADSRQLEIPDFEGRALGGVVE